MALSSQQSSANLNIEQSQHFIRSQLRSTPILLLLFQVAQKNRFGVWEAGSEGKKAPMTMKQQGCLVEMAAKVEK